MEFQCDRKGAYHLGSDYCGGKIQPLRDWSHRLTPLIESDPFGIQNPHIRGERIPVIKHVGFRRQIIRLLAAFPLLLSCCTKDQGRIGNGNYPDEIGKIVLNKCSTPGCHNTISKDATGGLSLIDWASMMDGGKTGPAVIPYKPEFSTLCFYTNTFSDLGPALAPTMPEGQAPLTRAQYLVLRDWIAKGAPDRNGSIFSGKQKNGNHVYVANQLCDVVTVIAAETKKPIRYIDVGAKASKEFPVCLATSPDGKYWYVSFFGTGLLQKFSVADNTLLGQINLGNGEWSSFAISQDGNRAWCAEHAAPGRLCTIELQSMKATNFITDPGLFYPRSVVANEKFICIGAEYGNFILAAETKDSIPEFHKIALDQDDANSNPGIIDPTVLAMDKERNRVFVGCASAEMIMEVDLLTQTVTRTVSIGVSPTAMVYETGRDRLWVSSMEDSVSFARHRGSVTVVDVHSMTIAKVINAGFESNGLALVSKENYLAVVNSNINPKGPAPHHVSNCAGRNGYITFIDLGTLELLPDKYELGVYPSAAATN